MKNFILFSIVLVSSIFTFMVQNKTNEPILPEFDDEINQIICIQEEIY